LKIKRWAFDFQGSPPAAFSRFAAINEIDGCKVSDAAIAKLNAAIPGQKVVK
jgi:hypothetical protein